jgi:peroxiredoxin
MKPAQTAGAAIVALALVAGVVAAIQFANAGSMAPNVAYTLLDGRKSSMNAQRGKVVLVNFWATDCVTCIKEMPQLIATHEKYKSRGFDTLAVSMRYNPPAYVIAFTERRRLPFGVAIDNTGEIARRFGEVQVTPTSLLIDKQGRIVERYVGEPDFTALHRRVEQLLAAS